MGLNFMIYSATLLGFMNLIFTYEFMQFEPKDYYFEFPSGREESLEIEEEDRFFMFSLTFLCYFFYLVLGIGTKI